MTSPEQNPYASPVANTQPLSPAEEKQWAMLAHLLGIFVGIPTAIVFYLLYRDRGPFVRAHTATQLNFQITLLICSVAAFFVCFGGMFASMATSMSSPLGPPPGIALFFVGYLGLFALAIAATVLGIVATVAANNGQFFRFPAFPFFR